MMLHGNLHNAASAISIYLLGNASRIKKKIDFSLAQDRQGYSDDGERNYGAFDEPQVRYIYAFLPWLLMEVNRAARN